MGQVWVVRHRRLGLVLLALCSAQVRRAQRAQSDAGSPDETGLAFGGPPSVNIDDAQEAVSDAGTFDVLNVADAPLFDSFGARRPGRAHYLKLTGDVS
jgi:hypothetical protein